jgi:type III secretory pathway lipoprotein EscJ
MDAHHSASPRDRRPLVSPAQVIALGLVAGSIGWAAWLLRDRPIREETELLSGSVLPSSELAIMEAAFDRVQLTDYRTEGGRVYVPRSRQSAYMRALVDAEALPREFGGSLRRALANNSPWQSKSVQTELLRVATQDELSLVLCSMPGIERAAVLYDVEEQSGLTGGRVKTASVSIRTQPETELDPTRVQSIRVLVAASIAGLAAERVAVTDLRSGRVFAGPLEEDSAAAVTDPTLARKFAYERALAAKVRQSLTYVKGAIVDVTVAFAAAETPPVAVPAPQPAPSPSPPELPQQKLADANAPAELMSRAPLTAPLPPVPPAPVPAAVPTASLARSDQLDTCTVSIAIPDSYLHAAVAARERSGPAAPSRAAVEAAELERIRALVTQMIPATVEPQGQRVMITCFPTAAPAPPRRETAFRGPNAELPQPPVAGRPGVDHSDRTARTSQPDKTDNADKAASDDENVSLAQLLKQFATSDKRLDARKLPREVWLAGLSVCVGLLSGLLWWIGARGQPVARAEFVPRQAGHPQIDWSRVDRGGHADEYRDDATDSDLPADMVSAHERRAAA